MQLEARTPVLALREMAKEHAADGDANLAKGTGREGVVGAPHEAHHRARRRCDLLRKLRITCQLQVEGTQLPRSVEALCESISRVYIGMSAQILEAARKVLGTILWCSMRAYR